MRQSQEFGFGLGERRELRERLAQGYKVAEALGLLNIKTRVRMCPFFCLGHNGGLQSKVEGAHMTKTS